MIIDCVDVATRSQMRADLANCVLYTKAVAPRALTFALARLSW